MRKYANSFILRPMCFSAGASFGAGIVLSGIGVASIKKAQSSSQLFFAGIPLIFSLQQFTEGFLWVALSNPVYQCLQPFTTYSFLFFAQILWPVWIPFSVLMLEKEDNIKKKMKGLVGIGIIISLYLGYCLFSFDVQAKIGDSHISYILDYPVKFKFFGGVLYIVATITPHFYSSIKGMRILGMAILISYIISKMFYTEFVVSVWCFFASVISIVIFLIMQEILKSYKKPVEAMA